MHCDKSGSFRIQFLGNPENIALHWNCLCAAAWSNLETLLDILFRMTVDETYHKVCIFTSTHLSHDKWHQHNRLFALKLPHEMEWLVKFCQFFAEHCSSSQLSCPSNHRSIQIVPRCDVHWSHTIFDIMVINSITLSRLQRVITVVSN